MSVKTKALVKTAEVMALGLAAGVGIYFLLGLLGPKLGLGLLLLSLIGWFVYAGWLAYDYYVYKFTVEEKFKL